MPADAEQYPQEELDPVFYGRFYRDLGLEEDELKNHWLMFGREEGRFPNLSTFLSTRGEQGVTLPADFSVPMYKFLNRGLGDDFVYEWEFIVHFIESGMSEGRQYRIEDDAFVKDLYKLSNQLPAQTDDLSASIYYYTSLSDLLCRNGILSERFLEIFNVVDYKTLVDQPSVKTRAQCVCHFVEQGIKDLIPIDIDRFFDPSFYRRVYGFVALDDEMLYREWINHGIESGCSPNEQEFLRDLGFSNVATFPSAFDSHLYLRWNPELAECFSSRWQALKHFIEFGVLENRRGCNLTPATADLYQIAADRISTSATPEAALPIYERILLVEPNHTLTLRHYADCLLRVGRHYTASEIYARTIELGKESIWTGLNLANCYEKLENWDAAIRTALRLHHKTPGDLALVRRLRELQRIAYEKSAGEAFWLAQNKFYEQALEKMRVAEAFLTVDLRSNAEPALAFTRNREILTIAIVADLGLKQCEFYRVDQKIEHITRAGHQALKYNYWTDIPKFLDNLFTIDLVIFYRVVATPEVVDAIRQARHAGVPTIYEIDDLMFDSRHFPDSFESYGGQISNDMYAGLVTGTEGLTTAMSLCDYGIASTPTLAGMMRPIVRRNEVFVHRNAFSKLHEAAQRTFVNRPLDVSDVTTIFYGTATKAHNSDFDEDCAPALARLFDEFGARLRLVVVGYLTLPPILIPYTDRITLVPPIWDMAAYWQLLATMDINLSVLKPSLLADCKSEIKWLEAAMLKVPTVMVATATHKDVALDGAAAALVHRRKDWYPVLRRLIRDKAKRHSIADAAYQLAASNYSIDSSASNITSIIDAIFGSPSARSRHRVLFVNVFFPPQAIGGATRVVADNVRYFKTNFNAEFEIEVFATVEGGLVPYRTGRYLWEGVPVTTVTTPSEADIDRKVSDPTMAKMFAQVLDRFKPDLVHIHCIQRLTSEICSMMIERDIPYLVTVHDAWWVSDKQFLTDEIGEYEVYDYKDPLQVITTQSLANFSRMQTLRSHLSAARKIAAVSSEFAVIYRDCGFDQVQVIENGVTPFAPLPRRERAGSAPLRIGYLGGLAVHKGYNIIRAALHGSHFDNLELLVIDHAMNPGTEHLTRWGDTVVRFRAKTSQQRVAELYAELDVLIAPSVWPESYGLVVREAMRAGCWVVASDRGAVGRDVTPETGQIIGVDSFRHWKEFFAKLNDNPGGYRVGNVGATPVRLADCQAVELSELYYGILKNQLVAEASLPQQPSHKLTVQVETQAKATDEIPQVVGRDAQTAGKTENAYKGIKPDSLNGISTNLNFEPFSMAHQNDHTLSLEEVQQHEQEGTKILEPILAPLPVSAEADKLRTGASRKDRNVTEGGKPSNKTKKPSYLGRRKEPSDNL
jgi:glycosyltransferase involved in cell wall biosynthesis/tetratricopeptide (TPR) repeat protein